MEPGKTMIINRFAIAAAALASLLMFSTAQSATKYYKWTDDAGVVHYGETPPDPSKAQLINVHTGPVRDQETSPAEHAKAAAEEKAASQAAPDLKKENDKIVQENCKIYKQNLSALNNSARIREKDAKGEYHYLSEEEKAGRIKDAETYIKENCQ